VGDVFTLGSATWRAIAIDDDRVTVVPATGSMPRMPFWRGELPHRSYYAGLRLGRFRRDLAERVAELPPLPDDAGGPWPREANAVIQWLRKDCALDEASACNAILYVRQQLDVLGAISSDRTVVVEAFDDALGDGRLVVHSCFGSRVNRAWAMALSSAMRERLMTMASYFGCRLARVSCRPIWYVVSVRRKHASACWQSYPGRPCLALSSE